MAASMTTMSAVSSYAAMSARHAPNVRDLGFTKSSVAGSFFLRRISARTTRALELGPRRGAVRSDAGDGFQAAKERVDSATKRDITADDIKRNQAQNESEKQSVFGARPTPGSSPYPRPELERRPETGSKGLGSIFAFDGAAPETINGRLAMVGMVWAALAEKVSGLTVFQQLYTAAGGLGLVYYLAVVQLITFASLIPFLNGESTDARGFGPFRAKAERWNGRLAMLGFLALVLTEQFTHTAIFSLWS